MSINYFTPADDMAIVDMYRAGARYVEIARTVGRSIGATSARIKALGLPQERRCSCNAPKCPRCTVLIAATGRPAAGDGLCVWCSQDK